MKRVQENTTFVAAEEKNKMQKKELLQYINLLENKRSQIEGEYDLCVNNVQRILFQIDAQGSWTCLGFLWVQMTGFSIKESLSTPYLDYVHPDDRGANQQLFALLMKREKKDFHQLIRVLMKTGEFRWMDMYMEVILNGDGTIAGCLGTMHEMNGCNILAEPLWNNLPIIAEVIQSGIWAWDMTSGALHSDRRLKAMCGYEENEINSSLKEWKRLCLPEEFLRISQVAQDYLAGKTEKFEVEYRIRHKDGSDLWVRSTGKAIYDHKNRPMGLVGSVLNITDSKRLEKLQKERELILRDFAQVVADVSFIIDEDGRYVEAFGDDEEMFWYPKENLRGRTIFDVLPKAEADGFLAEIRLAIKTQVIQCRIHIMDLPKGKKTLMSRVTQMNYTFKGKKTVVVTMQDVTTQEKMRRMLQTSYEMRRKNDFLNDILNGIRPADDDNMLYAQKMGLNFDCSLFCCIIIMEKINNAEVELDSKDLQGIIDEIMDELSDIPGCTVWSYRGGIGILCHVTELIEDSKMGSMHFAQCLQEKIYKKHSDCTVIIGIGEILNGLEGFKKSIQQAWEASRAFIGRPRNRAKVYHYRDLGVLQLLLGCGGRERTTDFIQGMIGKIIIYDREKGTDYLNTLEVILESASLKETAHKLFVHPNTVVYRKQRIEKMQEISINEFETKLALATAIKLYRLELLKKG